MESWCLLNLGNLIGFMTYRYSDGGCRLAPRRSRRSLFFVFFFFFFFCFFTPGKAARD